MAARVSRPIGSLPGNGLGHPRVPSSGLSARGSDIEACFEILRKLAPAVSSELPALATPSTSAALKRKLNDPVAPNNSSTADDSSKRQKRDSEQRAEANKVTRPESTNKKDEPVKSHDVPKARTESAASRDSLPAPTSLPSPAPSAGALASVSPQLGHAPLESPSLGGPWSKERFKRMAAICREKGRALKHSGDKRMREYQPTATNRHIPVLALFEQVDAIILYAYAFYCEDQAIGSFRTRQPTATSTENGDNKENIGRQSAWRAGCIAENWKSIFGLVAFVKGRAEKMGATPPSARSAPKLAEAVPRATELVVAWLCMLEALILQHLTTNTSRHLNTQASRLLSSNGPSPPGGDNESIGGRSSVSAGSSGSASTAPDAFLQSYMKMQADLEKIHSLWPASQAVLLRNELARSSSSDSEDVLHKVLRKGKMAYETEPTTIEDIVIPSLPKDEFADGNGPKSPEDLFKDEENYFSFAWPMVLHAQNTVAHATSFGRALITEISDRLDIGYKPESLE